MDRRKNTKTFKNYSILILILIIMMVMNAGAATFTSTLPMEPDTPVFPFGGEFTITLPAGFLDIELKDNEYFVYPPKTNSQELQNELLAKGILALSPPCGGKAVIGVTSVNMDSFIQKKKGQNQQLLNQYGDVKMAYGFIVISKIWHFSITMNSFIVF